MQSLQQPPTQFFLRPPSTLPKNLSALLYQKPLKSPKNRVFLSHLRNSSSPIEYVPNENCKMIPVYRSLPSPINCGINFVGLHRAYIVERDGQYLKTLRFGIHWLNPITDQIVDVHSLKEEVIKITIETINSDDMEIVMVALLYIKIVDPYLATYGKRDVDLISAVKQLIETKLPLPRMAEKMIFNPVYDGVKRSYQNGLQFNETYGAVDFGIFLGWGRLLEEFFEVKEIECDGEINKIAAGWGVECLRMGIEFYAPNESSVTWEDLMVYYDATYFRKNQQNKKKLYRVIKRMVSKSMKAIEIVREYYKNKRSCRGGDDSGSGEDHGNLGIGNTIN